MLRNKAILTGDNEVYEAAQAIYQWLKAQNELIIIDAKHHSPDIQFETSYENICAQLSSNTNQNPKELSAFEFQGLIAFQMEQVKKYSEKK